jgi:hypothetical protein
MGVVTETCKKSLGDRNLINPTDIPHSTEYSNNQIVRQGTAPDGRYIIQHSTVQAQVLLYCTCFGFFKVG